MNFVIVVSKFNSEITSRLLRSAKHTIQSQAGTRIIKVIEVPGAFEIPLAAKWAIDQYPDLDSVICLGAILQGKTDVNFHLASSVMHALQELQISTGVPISTGIISAPSSELAFQRTEGDLDRGTEAAAAALEMVKLHRSLKNKENNPFSQRLTANNKS